MLRAATLDYDEVRDRMGLVPTMPRKVWLISVPMFDNDGTGWAEALDMRWQLARRGKPRNLMLRYTDIALMPEGRVLVMIGAVVTAKPKAHGIA